MRGFIIFLKIILAVGGARSTAVNSTILDQAVANLAARPFPNPEWFDSTYTDSHPDGAAGAGAWGKGGGGGPPQVRLIMRLHPVHAQHPEVLPAIK
jgi:hypothetical protein